MKKATLKRPILKNYKYSLAYVKLCLRFQKRVNFFQGHSHLHPPDQKICLSGEESSEGLQKFHYL